MPATEIKDLPKPSAYIGILRTSDYGWSLLPLFVGWATMGWLLFLSHHESYWTTYEWTLESPQWPVFSDLNVVFRGMHDQACGIDPLTTTGSDYTYNYPRAWLALRYLGLHHVPLAWAGFLLGMVWVTVAVAIVRVRSPALAVCLSLILTSQPVQLALERANVDLLIFLLCVASTVLLAKRKRAGLSAALFAIAAILKLYPASGILLGALDASRANLIKWILVLVGVVCVWATQLSELALVASRTPRLWGASFGCGVLATRYQEHLAKLLPFDKPELIWLGVSVIGYGLFLLVAGWIGIRFLKYTDQQESTKKETLFFCLSASLCCGTFAFGNNFAYRLIFLIPAIPLWWRLLTTEKISLVHRHWAMVGMAGVAISLMVPIWNGGRIFLIVQAANWLLMGALAAGFCSIAYGRWNETRIAVKNLSVPPSSNLV
jgi:hypothetical protein